MFECPQVGMQSFLMQLPVSASIILVLNKWLTSSSEAGHSLWLSNDQDTDC